MKRAAIYARVSTDEQDTESQLKEVREYATRSGWASPSGPWQDTSKSQYPP